MSTFPVSSACARARVCVCVCMCVCVCVGDNGVCTQGYKKREGGGGGMGNMCTYRRMHKYISRHLYVYVYA